MKYQISTNEYIDYLFENSKKIIINNKSKIVFLSDTHMGNGGKNDDFNTNAHLFSQILKEQYYPDNFTLLLNGDIEELQKFSLSEIRKKWLEIYTILDLFQRKKRLIKTIGNHDAKIHLLPDFFKKYNHHDSIVLKYQNESIFVLHGHQFSTKFTKYNHLVGWILKYVAIPLGITNHSVAHNSRKKFKIEKRGYDYAAQKGIIAIIGHTHRPLFESMSKIDTLKYQIEHLLRHLHEFKGKKREIHEEKIRKYNKEIQNHSNIRSSQYPQDRLYSSDVILPNLFNSGCVIGKRGLTALEIEDGSISLVHWIEKSFLLNYEDIDAYDIKRFENQPYVKITIKKEPLSYIFNKIRLLR
ncbi:MAG: metallophosphoesterase [Spirochaetaceae bacterium]|jgi:UDP-2,3-diacylglucosamine pyrophosphatase LpxH|nr:metallophosphoesterase [Spirochaetaceae bacterium]